MHYLVFGSDVAILQFHVRKYVAPDIRISINDMNIFAVFQFIILKFAYFYSSTVGTKFILGGGCPLFFFSFSTLL